MKIRILAAAALAAAAISAPLAATASAGAATTGGSFTSAAVPVTNHDDSGTNSNGSTSNWAMDNYSAVLHLTGHGKVANSFCPGNPIGACHEITGTITDTGTYTTVTGDAVPGQGSLNGGSAPLIGTAVTGPFHGTLQYHFYANVGVGSFANSNSPNLGGVSGDDPSTQQWPVQFAPASAHFWDTSGNEDAAAALGAGPFSFTYTEQVGANSTCPNEAGQWVDASASGDGGQAVDGNIMASATC